MIIKEGLEENITLVGELPHAEVLILMQRSRLFLHCPAYEGFGSVCIEALCAGTEVVSFNKPMNENIQRWHIVNGKDEMTEKAISILQDPSPAYASVCHTRWKTA